MFRHIRANQDCALAAGETQPPKRQRVASLFGYDNNSRASGEKLLAAFQASLKHALAGCTVEFVGSTQSSVTNSRPIALDLERSCAAAEDVMVITFLAPDEVYQEKLGDIVASTQEALDGSSVALHSCRPLARDKSLHAEHSCTQHIFHYLVPMKWLPDHEGLLAWYNHQTGSAAPPALRRFKEILRNAESRTVKRQVIAHRFGALAHKERRPWHNYADPELCGQASPSHDTVWRVLDRARFYGYVKEASKDDDDVYIVYEFCGDEFLKQQVRRLVGTAVAMTHGWLPEDFLELSINREVIVGTPLAPDGLVYRAGSRFHRDEISFQGKQLFDSDQAITMNGEPRVWMQKKLVANSDRKEEETWLSNLQEQVAPRIHAQLQAATAIENDSLTSQMEFSAAPSEYARVLGLLQGIVEAGRWPTTSVARSTVIGNIGGNDQEQAGSFTVINKGLNQLAEENLPLGNSLFPDLAEAIFDLESVLADKSAMNHLNGFETQSRPSSSHCAVNCNAQFTPHVDSGKGAGQSLSLIAGLGNYSGGELMVEGNAHDIRYQALEFDGWKLRHWTKPFAGQRFSLVWFTPE